MKRRDFLTLAAGAPVVAQNRPAATGEIPVDVLEDKIRGGFLGQILGDLNGLKHGMKYILEPGDVREYTPALPEGGWTDDDTDIEWPYILEIQKTGSLLLPYRRNYVRAGSDREIRQHASERRRGGSRGFRPFASPNRAGGDPRQVSALAPSGRNPGNPRASWHHSSRLSLAESMPMKWPYRRVFWGPASPG